MIDKKDIKNMRQLLENMETEMKGRRLIRYMKGSEVVEITSEHFFEEIRKMSRQLEYRGLAGKHIGIMGKNSYEWLVSLCAIFWTGSVAVLLDWEASPDAIAELARQVELEALLCDKVTEENVRLSDLPQNVQVMSMELCMENPNRIENALYKEETASEPQTELDDLTCIFFTSGTTGKSKAVMMSGRGLIASVCAGLNHQKFEALLAVIPFHHMAGFITVLNTFYLGKEVCIAGDLKYFYRYLKEMQPDYVFVVPSMLKMLVRKLKKAGPHGEGLGWNLHIISCGGAAFCPEFLQILKERDITILQAYGASEAGAIGFLWEMTPERPNTIGKPPACLETKIVNGELYLRSESVMMGYYKDSEETKKVLNDGWYATGDLCRMDDAGYYYLTGRRKNLIILSNGENVSPEEIERKLSVCEEIAEIMVGVEQDLITATIYPNYPAGMDEASKRKVKEQIEREIAEYNSGSPVYKQIQIIHFQEEPFAKTAAGKTIRRSVTGGE